MKYLFPKGGDNPAKRPEVRAKLSSQKLGNNNPMKRPEVVKKRMATCEKNNSYGAKVVNVRN